MELTKGFNDSEFADSSYSHTARTAQKIADKFIDHLNEFHTLNIPENEAVLKDLYTSYIEAFDNPFKLPIGHKDIPMFRPSGLGGCPLEHYHRLSGSKSDYKDDYKEIPYQKRWKDIGTSLGDLVQKWVLETSAYYNNPTFKFEASPHFTAPHFEQFSTISKVFEHNGKVFRLQGSTDGIMIYTNEYGERLRVGLEVKSKQTSYAVTSMRNMIAPNAKHVTQITGYSLMFDVDYWIILYVNGSKMSWTMDETNITKYPDIRAFGVYVTEDMKQEALDKMATILDNVYTQTPPKMDLDGWTFNNYKEAIAKSLSEDELQEIKSNFEEMPKHIVTIKTGKERANAKRNQLEKIYNEILEKRGGNTGDGTYKRSLSED